MTDFKQPTTPEERLDFLRRSGSDTMEFRVRRDPSPDRTFSKEALEELGVQIQTFVGARIMDYWERTGVAPTDLTARVTIGATVTLTINGESREVPLDEVPYYEVDGALRH